MEEEQHDASPSHAGQQRVELARIGAPAIEGIVEIAVGGRRRGDHRIDLIA
jgi:hypothetical protein